MPDRPKSTPRPSSEISRTLASLFLLNAAGHQVLSGQQAELPGYTATEEPPVWRGDVDELVFARLPDILEILGRYAPRDVELPELPFSAADYRRAERRLATLERHFYAIVEILHGR